MKVRLTVYVDLRDRLAIARRMGQATPATHAQVKAEFESLIRADLEQQRDECCGFHHEGGIQELPCAAGALGDDT